MRPAAIIALTFAAATVAMISVGHAQSDQQQPRPKSNVARIPKSPEDYFSPPNRKQNSPTIHVRRTCCWRTAATPVSTSNPA